MIAYDKRGVSATKLAKEIEVTYKTAWLMLHKIRQTMRLRDAHYKLAGIVELDDAFFGALKEGGKRGRGTEKTKMLVRLSLNQIGGTLHELGSRHLQSYLDEFCYRFSRRKHEGELFSRLLHHCIGNGTITHRELVGT